MKIVYNVKYWSVNYMHANGTSICRVFGADSHEYSNDPSGLRKGDEFLNQVSNYWFLHGVSSIPNVTVTSTSFRSIKMFQLFSLHDLPFWKPRILCRALSLRTVIQVFIWTLKKDPHALFHFYFNWHTNSCLWSETKGPPFTSINNITHSNFLRY
jgi:hypothetical protein